MKDLTFETSNGITWNKNILECYNINNKNFSKAKRFKLPLIKNCYYQDDIWDFTEFNKIGNENRKYIYDFKKIDVAYTRYVKDFILSSMLIDENGASSVFSGFYEMKKFTDYLSKNKVYNLQMIDEQLIMEFFNENKYSNSTLDRYKAIIVIFLNISQTYDQSLNFDDAYNYLNLYDNIKSQLELENNKHKLIPLTICNKIVSVAIKHLIEINNRLLDTDATLTKETITEAMSCCMIIILAETGIRIGEFDKLEIDKLIKVGPKNEEAFFYLEFLTYKTSLKVDGHWTFTFMTDNAVFAYNTLLKVTSTKRRNSKYLYISKSDDKYKNISTLEKHIYRFFALYQEELEFKDMTEIQKGSFKCMEVTEKRKCEWYRGTFSNMTIGSYMYYVTPHQFRVTVATILYKKGYSVEFIRRHMNHMSSIMTQHYIRTEEIKNKESNIIEAIMNRASSEGDILETNIDKTNNLYIKQELNNKDYIVAYSNINRFLDKINSNNNRKVNLKVYEDILQVIEMFKLRTPITETELGFCVRDALIKLCERQTYISSIEDGYYIAPHIPTLESLEFNYIRFKEKIQVIKHNEEIYEKNPKYLNEVQREIKGIKKFIEYRLAPELILLKNEMKVKEVNCILENNKSLKEIIDNINSIDREVYAWMNKTL